MKNLVDIMNEIGLDKLNTMTKYPSIQTYHEINRGVLNPNLTDNASFGDEDVYVSEKVDGTNGRIIVCNGDYMIGSREEILYRMGDVFGNPSQGIYEIMKPYAEKLVEQLPKDDTIRIFYGEVYGSNINGARQYTKHLNHNVRFFDIVVMEHSQLYEVAKMDIMHISTWREHGGQNYMTVEEMHKAIKSMGFGEDNIVPHLRVLNGTNLPTTQADIYTWLKEYEVTRATIDEVKFKGAAEGVVVRNADRSFIRKIRFEDYEKTLRRFGYLSYYVSGEV